MNGALGVPYYSGPMRVTDQNGDPVTTLTNTDFTKQLWKDGSQISATGVTVHALSGGNYQATFIPQATGSYTLIISQVTYAPDGWAEQIDCFAREFIPVDNIVPGDPNAFLDALLPSDFEGYFTRDFKYLPAYNATKIYYIDDLVSLTAYGVTNFYKCLINGTVGIAPTTVTNPATWLAVSVATANYILDTDVSKAMNQARQYTNPEIFENNRVLFEAYMFCTAHYLVMDIRMAESGLDSHGEAIISSKSVGSVSVNYNVPANEGIDAQWAYFASTSYGQKYLSYVMPRVVGKPTWAWGRTSA